MPINAITSVLTAALAEEEAPSPCAEGERTCELVWDWTDNERLANWADVIIGKPLAILALIFFGLLVRWVLHKIIGRIARSRRPSATKPAPSKINSTPSSMPISHMLFAGQPSEKTRPARRVSRPETIIQAQPGPGRIS